MSNETDGRQLADEYRLAYNLGHAPLGDLFELIHSTMGLDVLSVAGPPAEHGLSMRDRETETTVIAVAVTEHPMRQRSSIAHELGHVRAGDLDDSSPGFVAGKRTPSEVRADAFARHLLLPLDAIDSSRNTLSALSDLVQEYGVSPSLAAIQLREAGLIDETTCQSWQQFSTATLAASYGWLAQYKTLATASLQPRAPQELMRRSTLAYARGVLGINELAAWYHVSADELEEELATFKSDQQEAEPETDPWNTDTPLFDKG